MATNYLTTYKSCATFGCGARVFDNNRLCRHCASTLLSAASPPVVCRAIGCDRRAMEGTDFCMSCHHGIPVESRKEPKPAAHNMEVAQDRVIEANRQMLLDRSKVGISKYGVTLQSAGLSRRQILQHALEEALDLANYLQTEIMRLDQEAADDPRRIK